MTTAPLTSIATAATAGPDAKNPGSGSPLTAVQRQQFLTAGYCAVPAFFTPREVDAMRRELDRLRALGEFKNVSTDGDGKTTSQQKANLQLIPIYPKSTLFRALPFASKVVSTIGQLIGDPFILHLDQVFLKPGRHGSGTNWHQDNAYFKVADPMMGTAMWIAIHDATIANGTIRVIPGVMKEKLEHSRDPESNHHIRCFPDEAQAVPVEIKAGGAVFFAYGTPHATGANNTDHERTGVALHFLRSDFAQEDLIQEPRLCRPVLSGPKATGGVAEYGVRVAGTWEGEVAAALK
ncbi:MAG: phytanoyl-CoA dioxygenase family protein [Planctomycetota bacterium]